MLLYENSRPAGISAYFMKNHFFTVNLFIKTKQIYNMHIPVRSVRPAPSISEVTIGKVLQTGKIRKIRDF